MKCEYWPCGTYRCVFTGSNPQKRLDVSFFTHSWIVLFVYFCFFKLILNVGRDRLWMSNVQKVEIVTLFKSKTTLYHRIGMFRKYSSITVLVEYCINCHCTFIVNKNLTLCEASKPNILLQPYFHPLI